MDDTMTGKAVADGAAPMQNAAGQNEAGQNKAGHDKAGHNEAGAKGAAGGAAPKRKQALPLLALGSLGVVFGDIGTSPLYALRQVFHDNPPLAHEPASVIGILSLIIWAVALAVCVKYTLLVMRADNDGEGGTLAMLGLIEKSDPPKPRVGPSVLVLLVLFGSALLYGDGVITPSISVLSAVEGLGVATSALKPVVLPLSVIILVALFLVQSRGTAAVGKLFGPVMLLWFSAIGGLGAWSLWQTPAILQCLNPVTGLAFLTHHGWQGYATLGAVVLAFSGVEALFADMGHFGRAPIVLAWYFVCLPGLVLNYLGEGALLLRDPHAGAEPFFGLVPHVALYPMVALSTAATVIASQALISGVFSLTQQAVNMGLAPPYRILHTSQDTSGQVYMPLINVLLMIGCVAIVLAFRSSDALGNAYGLAVIGTMTVTSIVFFIVMRRVWRWHLLVALPIMLAFLVFDVSFLGANLIKLLEGAWVPLAIGLCIFLLLWCWTLGRARFARALMQWAMPIEEFQRGIGAWEERRDGTLVFMTMGLDHVPLIGKHAWLRANCAYARVLLLRVETTRSAYVREADRVEIADLGDGLFTAVTRFGFMELPRAGDVLPAALPFPWEETVFVLGRPIASGECSFVGQIVLSVYMFLRHTGLSPNELFQLPPNQTISVGMELEI
jgi:KUP system potassium uptake protein